MNGNMLESGGKMTLHIRRNRKSVRRYGERRTRVMIRIGMRLILNTRKVGRRRVGNGMQKTLSIGHLRNSVAGNLHRIIRTIGRSGGCICKSGENGRRRKGNSFQFSVFSFQKSGLGNMNRTTTSDKNRAYKALPPREFPPTKSD